jgi:hypothetical protein
MGLSIYDERSPYIAGGSLALADGTTPKAIAGAVDGPLRIDSILVSLYCTTDRVVSLQIWDTALVGAYGTVNIPAMTGQAGAAPLDLVTLLVPASVGAIIIRPPFVVKVAVTVALGVSDGAGFMSIGGYV